MRRCEVCNEKIEGQVSSLILEKDGRIQAVNGHESCLESAYGSMGRYYEPLQSSYRDEEEEDKDKPKYCRPLSPNVPSAPSYPPTGFVTPVDWDYIDKQGLMCRYFSEETIRHKRELEREVGLRWWTGGKYPPYIEIEDLEHGKDKRRK